MPDSVLRGAAALAAALSSPVSAGKLRVLVVEDSEHAADSMNSLLSLLGHEVRLAHTGPEGLQQAQAWRPEVILCDIGLPGLDGYGVARELRADPTTSRARLVAVTAYGTDEDRARSKEAGFDVHLVKPVDLADLLPLLTPRKGLSCGE